jgi:glycerol-3-phosphate acyltransferase PlsY
MFLVTRIVSVGSLAAAAILPWAVIFFEWRSLETSKTIIIFSFIICGWVIFKHRTNIARLRDGTEGRAASDNSQDASEIKED